MKPVTKSDSNSHSSNSDLNAGRLTPEAQGAEMASGPNPDPFLDSIGESPNEYSSDPIDRLFFSDSDPDSIDQLLYPDSDSDLELLEPIPLKEEQHMVDPKYAARLQVSDPEDEQQIADPNEEEQISDPFADLEEEEQVSDPECKECKEQMDLNERRTFSNHTHRISTATESFHPGRTAGRQPRNPRRLFPNSTQASGLAGERTVNYGAPPALLAPRRPAYPIRTAAEYLETTHPSEMTTRRPRNRLQINPRLAQASVLAGERTVNYGAPPALLAPSHPAYRIRTAAEYLESTHPRRQQQTQPRTSRRIKPKFTQVPPTRSVFESPLWQPSISLTRSRSVFENPLWQSSISSTRSRSVFKSPLWQPSIFPTHFPHESHFNP